jgi:hypothetical protein
MGKKYKNKQTRKGQAQGARNQAHQAMQQSIAATENIVPPAPAQTAKPGYQSAPAAPTQQTHPDIGSASVPLQAGNTIRRKDQERAICAYEWAKAAGSNIKDYENAVQTFAAITLRSGLAVAVSVLERDAKRDAPKLLLKDLAAQSFPGLPTGKAADWAGWPARVRAISSLDDYMLATREVLALATWLRRACRAVRAMAEAQAHNAALQERSGVAHA